MMKWTNHTAMTGAITYIISGDIFAAMLSGAGATLPDAIEGKTFKPGIHRRVSHWFAPYLGLLLASVFYILVLDAPSRGDILSLFLSGGNSINPASIIAFSCLYIAIGALLHICEDTFCGKVPLFNPNKKEVGMSLFITGSGKEYLITALAVLGAIAFKFLKTGSII